VSRFGDFSCVFRPVPITLGLFSGTCLFIFLSLGAFPFFACVEFALVNYYRIVSLLSSPAPSVLIRGFARFSEFQNTHCPFFFSNLFLLHAARNSSVSPQGGGGHLSKGYAGNAWIISSYLEKGFRGEKPFPLRSPFVSIVFASRVGSPLLSYCLQHRFFPVFFLGLVFFRSNLRFLICPLD